MKFLLSVFCVAAFAKQISFDEWKKTYSKVYADSFEEENRRWIYSTTVKEVEELNSQNLSWTAGINEWSDLTWPEFKRAVGLWKAPQKCSATGDVGTHETRGNAPDKIDWRDKNAVTAVKNQGSCGSCWTFSATGAVESANILKGHKMTQFAEQQLVDCAGGFKNNGCNGGLPSQAFQYLMWQGGQNLESTYKYTARDGSCKFKKADIGVVVTDEKNITQGDEASMGDAVGNVGPVSVCYQVSSDFRNYKSGVYDSTKCKNGPMDVNHAVLAVGYDTDSKSSKPYWIIKNSWGTSFGIKGYFWMVRGKNMCGVATCSSYPVVA
jgi:cathepsin H